MSNDIEVKVPNIGDFKDIEIIEILVAIGDSVEADQTVITLESDKAAMDVPSSSAGVVKQILVEVGGNVSEGDAILVLEAPTNTDDSTDVSTSAAEQPDNAQTTETTPVKAAPPTPTPATTPAPATNVPDDAIDLLVLGSGPGGYTAAFRAADLGLNVVLIEKYPSIGGVCLNVGCIPSKALLHAAKVISETKEMNDHGLKFAAPEINIDKLRDWKQSVVTKLTGGLKALAKQRKVKIVQGYGRFSSTNSIAVEADDGSTSTIHFKQAIIAAGSEAVAIPSFPNDDPRLIDSTGALELSDIPKRLLVIGGGIIGLEMATVYHELGSEITVVEMQDSLIPGADADIVRPLQKRISKQYANIFLKTAVTGIEAKDDGLHVSFDGSQNKKNKAPDQDHFDKVLVSVGRRPNGKAINAEAAGVAVNEQGFIEVDRQQHTNVPHIYAIGDIVGQPMLAHKAVHEAKVAAEVAAGQKSWFDAQVIPSVAYTDPEIAWVGVTEKEAKAEGRKIGKASFPWAASGRSLSLGRSEGITKTIYDPETNRIIGAGIVGPNAGDLIAEVALAIEMGADAEDIGLTIHPHPTLSETVAMSAEAFEGTITDLYMPKKK